MAEGRESMLDQMPGSQARVSDLLQQLQTLQCTVQEGWQEYSELAFQASIKEINGIDSMESATCKLTAPRKRAQADSGTVLDFVVTGSQGCIHQSFC